jgi:class 3 adenylate cyclase/YHS domain-containing protein
MESKNQSKEEKLYLLIADLAGYTAMTEVHGSFSAAQIINNFNEIIAKGIDGQSEIVEQVGDEVFIVSRDNDSILNSALNIHNLSEIEPDFPRVKMGIHVGMVLHMEGRYFGPALNLVSRLAGYAKGGQIICSEYIKKELTANHDVSIENLGYQNFKNVKHSVSIYRLIPKGSKKDQDVWIDPVCRMRINAGEIPEMVRFRNKTYYFCSVECKEQFLKEPEHYISQII